MSSVAEQLRHGREALKMDVYQVAEATKIRTDHIRALEEGDYDAFVAPVYIRGFVRTYAGLLKLDVPQVMRDLGDELGRTEKFAEPPSLTGQPKGILDWIMLYLSRVDWRILVAILALALLIGLATIGYRAWEANSRRDPLKRLGPGTYQPPRSAPAPDTLPLPGAPR